MLVEIISTVKIDVQKEFIEALNLKTKEGKETLLRFIETNVPNIVPYEIHIKIDSTQNAPEKWDKVVGSAIKFSLNGEEL